MKTVLLWDSRFPDRRPSRLTIDDAVASLAVRSGVATAADPADAGVLSVGGIVSNGYPVEIALVHGVSSRTSQVVVPLAIARAAVAASIATILPPTLVDSPIALRSADNADFLVSPFDGQQLLGVK